MNLTMTPPTRPALESAWASVREDQHHHRQPSETAVEEVLAQMVAAGLYPWPRGEGPSWYCERCRGEGPLLGLGDQARVCIGHSTEPREIHDVVAVVSLGVVALRAAVELAGLLVGGDAHVVWHVMDVERLRNHHADTWSASIVRMPDRRLALHEAFSSELNRPQRPFTSLCDFYDPNVSTAWPVLSEIAALGFHVTNVSERRVTLAVEGM